MASISTESHPMTGGNGQYSYTRNSTLLKKGVESLKALIEGAIQEKLDMKEVISSSPSKVFTIADSSSPSKVFTIADLGYSIGPNTFIAVQNIIEPVKLKYKSTFQDEDDLQFQGRYFAAGIPGQFQGRLFPKASLHPVHSSYALHWLSRTPKELETGLLPSDCVCYALTDLLEASLLDMGLVSQAQIKSFDLPTYQATPQELGALIKRNGCFSIERSSASLLG
ncbi:hypothetical protein SLEP1_g10770 [Rubroshorea leprosula]|uniref:S-adenosylmethionine-dependent methyltransferase n=1 Tax=Rubroshorea leprosula TaxID=152421 RepID=A0AAV5I948_9ROSI|nr:hypothetical protein SLEP1_g10770 [Rubroshorea leprosula]